jgi:predicted permease
MQAAMRRLRRNPGFAVTVVLLLGFGIGANTALFTLFRVNFDRPIPGVKDSGELVRVRRAQNGRVQGNQSYPDYTDFRDASKTVTGLIAGRLVPIRLDGVPARIVSGAIVTGNYFQLLGVRATLGRLLSPEDDRQAAAVAVVSEAFWAREGKGDAHPVGAVLNMNGYPFTIVGVAAAPFEGVEYGEHTEIWMPMSMVRQAMTRAQDFPFLTARNAGWLTWFGRLRHGASLSEAQHEWNAIAMQLRTAYPLTNAGRNFELHRNASMAPGDRAEIASLLSLLFAAVGLILLIACGNVANLMLARAAGQTREMAIRLALGASRPVLVRQALAESGVLAAASGALGLLLAPWMAGVLGTVGVKRFRVATGSIGACLHSQPSFPFCA